MASICKFFDEDAVYKINKKKFIDVGLVLENSEYLSSDEEEEDPDYKDWGERMKKGHIRVAWHPNGAEEVLPEKKVRLCDRSLMPGDVVRKIVKGRDTQLGYCRCTRVTADVQVVGTKRVVTNVHSTHLTPLEEFVCDVAVFKDSWVGMVKTVKTELTLKCSDGSRCHMSDVDAFDMEDVLDRRERASEFKKYSFYPGQQLWGPAFCFQKVKWIHLNKSLSDHLDSPTKTIRATVEEVRVVSMGVQWVCKAYSVENLKNRASEQPKYQVTGEDLKSIRMMNIFEPCTLQIGDRNYLLMRDSYEVVSLSEWKNRVSSRFHSSPDQQIERKLKDALREIKVAEVEDLEDSSEDKSSEDASSVTSRSTVSSVENNLPCLAKKKQRGPHYATKKKKLKSVRRRAMRHVMRESLPLKAGDKLVTEALLTETRAHVVWQDGSVENDILSTSLYPVHHLDSHEFFPGDYVVDAKDSRPYEYGVVRQVDHSGRTALVTWLKTYQAGGTPHPEILFDAEVSVYDIKDHPDFKYRPGACVIRVVNPEDDSSNNENSTAGQVVDVHPSGKVEVSWVSGESSLCYPQELYRVGEYDSDDLWADDDSISDEDSWETESEKSLIGLEEGVEGMVVEEVGKEEGEDMQEKLLANIEKLRAGMARLEEVFTQNPTLQTCNVMRRLLELYKHCKVLDQLLGTTYFHERHLQSLVERLKHRGRVNSIQHMADQIFRLFSNSSNSPSEQHSSEELLANNSDRPISNSSSKQQCNSPSEESAANNSDRPISNSPSKQQCNSPTEESVANDSERPISNSSSKQQCNSPSEEANNPERPISDSSSKQQCNSPSEEANNSEQENSEPQIVILSPVEEPKTPVLADETTAVFGVSEEKRLLSPSSEPRNLCQQLCAILKSRLLKAHEDAELRFGMPRSETSAGLLAAEETNGKTSGEPEMSSEDLPAQLLANGEEESSDTNTAGQGVFSMLECVSDSHKYKLSIFQPTEPSAFFRIVRREMNLLRSSLPPGIIVKSFEDRIDLYSVLIRGPLRTPYEDGLFFFEFQLPPDYPRSPPYCHYCSYCSDRLNPNLYEGGKVCVSLLGTWGGKGTEMWNPDTSNLLQVIVSIQGLILVSEPYYNEAGYERQKGTQLGMENSRMYNEMVVLKLVQSMTKLLTSPPEVFKEEIKEHFKTQSSKMVERLERWLEISESWNAEHPPTSPFKQDIGALPEFPLLPASKGFCLTLRKSLSDFQRVLRTTRSS